MFSCLRTLVRDSKVTFILRYSIRMTEPSNKYNTIIQQTIGQLNSKYNVKLFNTTLLSGLFVEVLYYFNIAFHLISFTENSSILYFIVFITKGTEIKFDHVNNSDNVHNYSSPIDTQFKISCAPLRIIIGDKGVNTDNKIIFSKNVKMNTGIVFP